MIVDKRASVVIYENICVFLKSGNGIEWLRGKENTSSEKSDCAKDDDMQAPIFKMRILEILQINRQVAVLFKRVFRRV